LPWLAFSVDYTDFKDIVAWCIFREIDWTPQASRGLIGWLDMEARRSGLSHRSTPNAVQRLIGRDISDVRV